jgi:hypothetical protein
MQNTRRGAAAMTAPWRPARRTPRPMRRAAVGGPASAARAGAPARSTSIARSPSSRAPSERSPTSERSRPYSPIAYVHGRQVFRAFRGCFRTILRASPSCLETIRAARAERLRNR